MGKNLALGIGEGFIESMKDVSREMAAAVPDAFEGPTLNITRNMIPATAPAAGGFYNTSGQFPVSGGDTIINVYNPQPNPAELARQIKKNMQQLALGF